MRTGFKFRGRHTSEFGLTMLTKSRPILPEKRSNLIDLPGADGSIEYAAVNDFGRAMYQNRKFTMSLHIAGSDIFDLQRKLSRAAAWLSGGAGELIFDDMPTTIWTAEVKGNIDYVPERSGTKAILEVEFDVQPFSYVDFTAAAGPSIGAEISIGESIPMGGQSLSFDVAAIRGAEYQMNFYNCGTAPVRPVISVEVSGCPAGQFELELNGNVLAFMPFTAPMGAVVIDTDAYSAKIGNNGVSASLNGGVFELNSGDNIVTFRPIKMLNSSLAEVTKQTYKINVDYTPKFLYAADFGGDV